MTTTVENAEIAASTLITESSADFVINFNGRTLNINWLNQTIPKVSGSKFVKRLCTITADCCLIILTDHNLYSGKISTNYRDTIDLVWEDEQLQDIGYCGRTHQLFKVYVDGTVIVQEMCNDKLANYWRCLVFDPLELCEDGVRILRVCCSADGALFESANGELYAFGSCGEIFNNNATTINNNLTNPQQVRLFDTNNLRLLQMTAGDDFFVLLLAPKLHNVKRNDENDDLCLKGSQLLHTIVYTFGVVNNGVLGIGDHMRRNSVQRLHRLWYLGVKHIAAEQEFVLASCLDGRIFEWGRGEFSTPTEYYINDGVFAVNCYKNNCLTIPFDDIKLPINLNTNMSEECKTASLLLTSGLFSVRNNCLSSLMQDKNVRLNIKHWQNMLTELIEERTQWCELKKASDSVFPLFFRQFEKIVYLHAALLQNVLDWSRGENNLLLCKNTDACILLLRNYTRSVCDLVAWNQFDVYATPYNSSNIKFLHTLPYSICEIYMEFLKLLTPTPPQTVCLEKWQDFLSYYQTQKEQAENTRRIFWRLKDRYTKLVELSYNLDRRIVLDSAEVAIRHGHYGTGLLGGSQTLFVLCNDALFQLCGFNLLRYDLKCIWLQDKSARSFFIKTPENSIYINGRENEKQHWWQELCKMIEMELSTNKLSVGRKRLLNYKFGGQHQTYRQVSVEGEWCDALMHGHCRLEFPDGNIYCGQMYRGVIEGYGQMYNRAEGLYEGYFKSGKFHGFGIYEMSKKLLYEGYFRHGLFHGHGTMRSNYFTHVGQYKQNVRCGYGILDDMTTGVKYLGMFSNDKRQGPGICITMSGDYFEGIFANDELSGNGIAILINNHTYEGELNMDGPCGQGTYFMPTDDEFSVQQNNTLQMNLDWKECKRKGNILQGQLCGKWKKINVTAGSVTMNQEFSIYPKNFGNLVYNNEKWCALFRDFLDELYGNEVSLLTNFAEETYIEVEKQIIEKVWMRILRFMRRQAARLKALNIPKMNLKSEKYDQSTNLEQFLNNCYLAHNNISRFTRFENESYAQLINNTTNHYNITNLTQDIHKLCVGKQAEEEEEEEEKNQSSQTQTYNYVNAIQITSEQDVGNNLSILNSWTNESNISFSSIDSILHISDSESNLLANRNENLTPNYGMFPTLTHNDLVKIKQYLEYAFKDPLHPLYILNQCISNVFYSAYGCWRVKPTPLITHQALNEWKSISKRVYAVVRSMFRALPEDYIIMEETREVVSHMTLLSPIMISDGIYSTLFVLYANKYNKKDEIYGQHLSRAERYDDYQLAKLLRLDNAFHPIISHEHFSLAINTLRQLQAKYNPKDMLTVIERCIQQITETQNLVSSESHTDLWSADCIMPLTLYLVLRAGVPHLGAELALLEDLTDCDSFQFEMNGLAGYCFTTLKAAYEHITNELMPCA